MSTNSEPSTRVPPAAPADQGISGEAKSLLLPIVIPPMIERSQSAFRRDLPALMKTHYRQWVAYHGDARIGSVGLNSPCTRNVFAVDSKRTNSLCAVSSQKCRRKLIMRIIAMFNYFLDSPYR